MSKLIRSNNQQSSLTATWNNAGINFTAWKLNVTDTASGTDSLLTDIQVGGVSKFAVTKEGRVRLNNTGLLFYAADSSTLAVSTAGYGFTPRVTLKPGGVFVTSEGKFGFCNTTSANGTVDALFIRDDAGIIAQRNGANTQAFRVYGTYTDASNYTRLAIGHNGTSAFINEEVAGTGTAGGIAFSAASLSGSQATSLLSLSQTWNTTGAPTAIKLNVTDTASNAASLLIDLQAGGTSKFRVSKEGNIRAYGATGYAPGDAFVLTTQLIVQKDLRVVNNFIGFSTGTFSASDVNLYRDAAGILAQRNTTNTQAFRLYRTYTDSSNYEALELAHATYSTKQYSILRTITAGTGDDSINLVLQPAGNGGIMARLPDGTTTGGNARGAYAIDLQCDPLVSAIEVASGNSAVAIGSRNRSTGDRSVALGYANLASGNRSFAAGEGNTASGGLAVAMGRYCTASATESACIGGYNQATGTGSFAWGSSTYAASAYSTAGGLYSKSDKQGQASYASGRFAADGDAQRSALVARQATTDAIPTELFLDGTSVRTVLPNNTRWLVTVRVVASTNSATAEWASFQRCCLIGRTTSAATTAIVGEVQTINSDIGTNKGSPPDGWSLNLSADTTNGSLKIEATGVAGKTIRWVAHIDLVEVGFA